MLNRRSLLVGLSAFPLLNIRLAFADDNDAFQQLLASIELDSTKFPGASGRVEAKEFESSSFGAAQPKVGKSTRQISGRATQMITAFEVSNEKTYEKKYRRPIWPHGASGVTIGVGYDLGYVNVGEFEEDWKEYLAAEARKTLTVALGKKGNSAKNLLADCQSVEVPFKEAFKQFKEQTLPKYVALTESALRNTDELSDDSMGALVSLTFNRGASYKVRKDADSRGRYEEMRAIRRLMQEKKFADIPAEIRKMKRLWVDKPEVKGLLDRRDIEADLFELGL